MKKPYIF